ncbi:MAG: type II CRISPR RNA-guided endonuclease Cas9, partial [Treponema sp.]
INRVQTPIPITSSSVPRYLCPEDYLAAIVWQIPPQKKDAEPEYKATYLRRDEFDEKNKPKSLEKPHDAAKYICMLYKDDYLEFIDEKGTVHLCRIAGFSATQNKLDIRPIYAVSDCKDWIIATSENMLESYWEPKKGQNYISVNVLFAEHKARSVTVNQIGRVFRK